MHAGKLFTIALAVLTVPLAPGVALGDGLDGHGSAAAEPFSPAAPVERVDGGILEEGLLDKLDDGSRGVIVHFEDAVPANLADLPGIQPSYTFESIPAVYVLAHAEGVRNLADAPGVRFIEDAEKPLAFHLETATIASRAREVFDPYFTPPAFAIDEDDETPLLPGGTTIDGSGIGIAVVDTGLDGLHPDFQAPGKLAGNHQVTSAGVAPAAAYTGRGSAHGTLVAGTAAGTGAASADAGGPDRRGAAPGASLHTFAIGGPWSQAREAVVVQPAIAFDWILQHGGDQEPPIRVVVNAWTCQAQPCRTGSTLQAHMQLAEQLAEEGIVTIFSVGNQAGSGWTDRTSPESKLATPGVLGVGAHDDEEHGGRDDCTKSISSRGRVDHPLTWPDVLAPGDDVWTPNAVSLSPDTRVPGQGPAERKSYIPMTSTSAAAGHAGGIAALVLQANPSLTAGEVEYILKATAEKNGEDCDPFVRADPSHPWGTANHAAGHGLIDAVDAVHLALDFGGIPDEAPALEPIPDALYSSRRAVEIGQRLFVGEDHQLTPAPGQGSTPSAYVVPTNDAVTFVSEPFDQSRELGGMEWSGWIGTSEESMYVGVGFVTFRFTVEARSPDGGSRVLLEEDEGTEFVITGTPSLRDVLMRLEEPTTVGAGERLAITLELESLNVEGAMLLYHSSSRTPSHLSLGSMIHPVRGGTDEACQLEEIVRQRCARIGVHRPDDMLTCDRANYYGVEWTGPPGSRATAVCNGAVVTCVVPGGPEDPWGTCEASSLTPTAGATDMGRCTYTTPPGAGIGSGRCATGYVQDVV